MQCTEQEADMTLRLNHSVKPSMSYGSVWIHNGCDFAEVLSASETWSDQVKSVLDTVKEWYCMYNMCRTP